MAWKIEISQPALNSINKLGSEQAKRILMFLDKRLAPMADPRELGAALQGSRLGDLWKYRVGDYRIICDIQDEVVRILVVKIGHRSDVYN
jgi:mRNA interferase RelE/StbE